MLETEEVDEDFFTPVASTSLANIFEKPPKAGAKNNSLKYVAPKAQTIPDIRPLPKVSECVFACALFAYQWINNGYKAKGKIGFAIMKYIKDNTHNIVLYDSSKQSLSTTKITPDLVVSVKANSYISYYDNQRNYWNVYSTQGEIMKIVELLSRLHVNVKNITITDNIPPESEPHKDSIQFNLNEDPNLVETKEKEKDSDSDSIGDEKTKASILNRMATMGQSVLPHHAVTTEKRNDSSDTNDTDDNQSLTGYGPSKTSFKKPSHKNLTAAGSSAKSAKKTYYEKQLVPIQSKSSDHYEFSTDTDLKLFITEQRINNTEVRMNINRLSDKLDQVIEKSRNTNNSTFQMEIFQKLIAEYEAKIKVYEKSGKPKKIQHNVLPIDGSKDNEKESIIAQLNIQIREHSERVMLKENENKLLLEEIEKLKKSLIEKEEDIEIEKNKLDIVADVIKTVMNDTFVRIVEKFKDGQNYSSDFIKSVIAEVIKQSTVHYLTGNK